MSSSLPVLINLTNLHKFHQTPLREPSTIDLSLQRSLLPTHSRTSTVAMTVIDTIEMENSPMEVPKKLSPAMIRAPKFEDEEPVCPLFL